MKPGAAICHGAVVVMIKYQSSTLLSFPNYRFHLLHYITFVEQKVMIQLGDCQVIFFPTLSYSPSHCLRVCLRLSPSPFTLTSLSSSVFKFWCSPLKVACGDKIAMPTRRESQPRELSPAGGHADCQSVNRLLYGCGGASKRGREVRKVAHAAIIGCAL